MLNGSPSSDQFKQNNTKAVHIILLSFQLTIFSYSSLNVREGPCVVVREKGWWNEQKLKKFHSWNIAPLFISCSLMGMQLFKILFLFICSFLFSWGLDSCLRLYKLFFILWKNWTFSHQCWNVSARFLICKCWFVFL